MRIDDVEVGQHYAMGSHFSASLARVEVLAIDTKTETYGTFRGDKRTRNLRRAKIRVIESVNAQAVGNEFLTNAKELLEPWSTYDEKRKRIATVEAELDDATTRVEAALAKHDIEPRFVAHSAVGISIHLSLPMAAQLVQVLSDEV